MRVAGDSPEVERMSPQMRNTLVILLVGLTTVAIPATASPLPISKCSITRAIYTQPGNPGIVMGFTPQKTRSRYASDLVLFVKQGQQQFWFGFDMPNGYGGPYITPQRDPRLVKPVGADAEDGPDDRLGTPAPKTADGAADGDSMSTGQMDFDAFDAKLMNLGRVPQKGDKPPAFLFARGLGPLFHYAHNGDLYHLTKPVGITRDMWRLTGCDKVAH
jgi:hypothetical protein